MVDLNNNEEIEEFVKQHYRIFLEREADETGLKHYVGLLKNNELKPEELKQKFEESIEHKRLKSKWELAKKINKELEEILIDSKTFEEYLEHTKRLEEPRNIFVTCYNETTNKGGVFLLNDSSLEPIYEQKMCSGMFFSKDSEILFTITKEEPQIVALKGKNGKWESIPIKTKNTIFANDAHDIIIWNNKIIISATGGDPKSEIVENPHEFAKEQYGEKVGKLIISDIEIKENEIIISDSKVFDPFECKHHHHINDFAVIENSLFMTSHSYCDTEKNLIKKGAISKIDEKMNVEIISDKLEQPHSLYYFRNRLYVCSSAQALVLSMNKNERKLRMEFKGLNAYTRGLLITDNYFYIGTSFGLGRTNSKFSNPNYGVLKFNRDTGETIKINIPSYCDNVYAIISR